MGTPERWGTFGEQDERGALNLLSADLVRDAAGLVRNGEVIQLGQSIGARTPIPPHRLRAARFMDRDGGDYAVGAKRPGGFQFAEDTVLLPTHIGTHIDALAHVWHSDLLYNGFPGGSVRSTTGAQRCGADKLGPIIGRGVMIDMAASTCLEVGEEITAGMLRKRLAEQGDALQPGDIVLIRTGWLERHRDDADAYFQGEPGPDLGAGRWLAEQGAAVVGCDNFAVEPLPFPEGQVFPVHQYLIRDCGIPLLEGLELEGLAETSRSVFLFVALPLRLEGCTASPLNPVAVL